MVERRARGEEDPGRVRVLVCMTCGRQYMFDGDEAAPADLQCEKCGSMVFRPFEDAADPDEAAADFREGTERDLAPDDPEGDTTPGDLHDLNR